MAFSLDTVTTKFGFELEMCYDTTPAEKLEMRLAALRNRPNPLLSLSFKEKFDRWYAQHKPPGTVGLRIDKPVPALWIYEQGAPPAQLDTLIDERFNKYKIPIFTEDISVTCDPTMLSMECITPVLSIKGAVTLEDLRTVLAPYFTMFGFDHPQNLLPNHTTAFQVTVSMEDASGQRICIDTPEFLRILVQKQIAYEREKYSLVRPPPASYAGPPGTYRSSWALPMMNEYNRRTQKLAQTPEDTLSVMSNRGVTNDKEGTFFVKYPQAVIEFRMFQAMNSSDTLTGYTYDVLRMMQDSLQEYNRLPAPVPGRCRGGARRRRSRKVDRRRRRRTQRAR